MAEYTLNDAIARADERCARDDGAYVVLEDTNGDFIVQSYEARYPQGCKCIYQIWPHELKQRRGWI